MSVAAPATTDPQRPVRTGRVWTGAGRIDSGTDVDRLLATVNAGGRRRDRTASLTRAVDRVDDLALGQPDGARILPVAPELAPLLPWPGGIRRGATVAAVGSTSLLFALLADAMASGCWAGIVGMPALGVAAAVEYGIDPARLALVPEPGEHWQAAVAALVDGLDLVVVSTPGEVPDSTARALMARVRQRGCVLLPTRAWPGCDLTLHLVDRRWRGLGQGRGRLRQQQVTVRAAGRGRAHQPREVGSTMPPPSVAARVCPLPGQIPGLHERFLEPRQPCEPTPAPRPAGAAPPPADDGWRRLWDSGREGRPGRPPDAVARAS